jgi:hypothetical protein
MTPYQRAEIVRLLKKLEFDHRTVTFQHRRLGVPEAVIGGTVDAWLSGMSQAEASAMIEKMRGMQ